MSRGVALEPKHLGSIPALEGGDRRLGAVHPDAGELQSACFVSMDQSQVTLS